LEVDEVSTASYKLGIVVTEPPNTQLTFNLSVVADRTFSSIAVLSKSNQTFSFLSQFIGYKRKKFVCVYFSNDVNDSMNENDNNRILTYRTLPQSMFQCWTVRWWNLCL
jgi:hypothetical protein